MPGLILLLFLLVTGQALAAEPHDDAHIVDADGIRDLIGDTIIGEIAADLNDDGIPDRMIAPVNCGNAGCHYFLFIRLPADRYRHAGSVFLHALGFEVLQTKHNGLSDLLAYSRWSASEGSLIRYEFNGSEYRQTAQVRGNSALFDLLRPAGRGQSPR